MLSVEDSTKKSLFSSKIRFQSIIPVYVEISHDINKFFVYLISPIFRQNKFEIDWRNCAVCR